jgi:hypothetical protein
MKMYAALPMSFEANTGQTDPRVKFLARAPGYTLFLTDREAVLSLPASSPAHASAHAGHRVPQLPGQLREASHPQNPARAVRLKFVGASTPSTIAGRDPLPGKTNYFIGSDPHRWHTNVPNYSAVEYLGIYSGVDAVFHGDNRRLEFDFIVAPGANPNAIGLDVEGAERVSVDSRGNLTLHAGGIEVECGKPIVYQEVAGRRREIAGSFALSGKHRAGFSLGDYDRSLPLVIDPTLIYSTLLGGSGSGGDTGTAVAVDSSGDVYVTGSATSPDFPVTAGAFESTYPDGQEAAFVSKLNPGGSALVYSTFFYGSYPSSVTTTGIALDASGDAYLTGYTSGGFPTTPGAFDSGPGNPSNSYAFATELNPTGTGLVYSTLLGQTNPTEISGTFSSGIAVDTDGNAYVLGTTGSPTYPTTPGAYQTALGCAPCFTGFVTKINAGGASLSYSTYLGGAFTQTYAIALDSSDDAFVAGSTVTSTFPVTPGAFLTSTSEPSAVFVTKLNPTGTALVYSTFLDEVSSGPELIRAIAVDGSGYAYVTGQTTNAQFPTTPGAYKTGLVDDGDAFVAKLNLTGSALEYSTLLPGETAGYGIAVNSVGEAFVAGINDGYEADFPTTPGALQTRPPTTTTNGFLTVFSADGTSLVYSTYLGNATQNQISTVFGIALDVGGNAYVTGAALQGFPTTPGALKTTLTTLYPTYTENAIIMKFAFAGSSNLSISPTQALAPGMVNVRYLPTTITATGGTGSYTWSATGLPAGMSIAPATGTISGTPGTNTGSPFTVVVTVTDSRLAIATSSYQLTIYIATACDVAGIGALTVADVQFILNELLGLAPVLNDLDHNGVVNVADVQLVINALLGLGCAAT